LEKKRKKILVCDKVRRIEEDINELQKKADDLEFDLRVLIGKINGMITSTDACERDIRKIEYKKELKEYDAFVTKKDLKKNIEQKEARPKQQMARSGKTDIVLKTLDAKEKRVKEMYEFLIQNPHVSYKTISQRYGFSLSFARHLWSDYNPIDILKRKSADISLPEMREEFDQSIRKGISLDEITENLYDKKRKVASKIVVKSIVIAFYRLAYWRNK
jgi:hypothetical protein